MRIIAFMLFLICIAKLEVSAEIEPKPHKHDTNYYHVYPEDITIRTYLSQKFTGFNVGYKGISEVLRYQPNTTRNLGLGVTYKWMTLNLAFGFGFLNPDNGRGNTRYLDLQSHQYIDNWNIDLFGQFYEGYFLRNPPTYLSESYIRPDLSVVELGTSVQYVVNNEKFHFKAAFLNTEYQKKSAGTLLFGGDFFYANVSSDSALTPYFYTTLEDPKYRALEFVKFGPSAGYAYNWVIKQHLYFSGSLTFGFNAGLYRLESSTVNFESHFFSVDTGIRAAMGYATEVYNIGLIYVLQTVQASNNYNNNLRTGNIRLVLSYRFEK